MRPSQHTIWQTIGGWYETRFCDELYKLALATPANAVIVELGAFNGRSGLAMGLACLATERRLWLVDNFSQNACQAVLRENIIKMGLGQYCSVIDGVSWEIGEGWKLPVHLLHIDAGHELDEVARDLDAWLPHVTSGGVVVLHDFERHGPSLAAREALGEPLEVWTGDWSEFWGVKVGVYRV